MTLHHYLILAAVLFCVGLMGAFTRRNAIVVLFSVEIMLNAANLNFIAFWRYSDNPELLHGPMFTLFAIAVAAAACRRIDVHAERRSPRSRRGHHRDACLVWNGASCVQRGMGYGSGCPHHVQHPLAHCW